MFDWLKKAFRKPKSDYKPQRRPEPEFRPAKLPPRRNEQPTRTSCAPLVFTLSISSGKLNGTIQVEQAMFVHFKQPSGPSRPGALWHVKIAGDIVGAVGVRSYLPKARPDDSEIKAVTEKVVNFVFEKLRHGWRPPLGSTDMLDMTGDNIQWN
jgi:hypothetical protein